MMWKSIFLAVLCCILVAGCLATSHTCYFCEVLDKPVGSDCWNRTSQTAKVVNCSLPCYTQIFQSGGSSNPNNYWSIKRGCTGEHNDEETCEESNNCDNRYFGTCTTCCSTDLCNGAPNTVPPCHTLIAVVTVCILIFFHTT